mgnify:CR=1 FL=1
MAIIYSYPRIDELSDDDNLIISDVSNENNTRSVTIDKLSDYLGISAVRQAKKVLGPDEILSLSGPTPQFLEFVPAPGENKLIMPINVAYKLTPVSVPYNLLSGNLQLVLNSFAIGLTISNINSSQVVHGWDSGVFNISTVSDVANQPINFTFNAETVSQGDSILTVSMLYRIIDFS